MTFPRPHREDAVVSGDSQRSAASSDAAGGGENLKHVVSFSGGQTSGMMLLKLRDENAANWDRDFIVMFANTGREHDKTLEYVHRFETDLGFRIVWVEYDREGGEVALDDRKESGNHGYRVVDFDTAHRIGSPGKSPFDKLIDWTVAIPNVRQRRCSGHLKERVMRRYLKSLGVEQDGYYSYIGIRADEAHRALEIRAACPKRIRPRFPLIDMGVTYGDVNRFWDKQPFKLEIPNYMGNCDLCFLKAKWKRLAIMRRNPELAEWWIEQQDRAARRGVARPLWKEGEDYRALLAEATHPELPLGVDETEQDIPCSCAVGGFRETELDEVTV